MGVPAVVAPAVTTKVETVIGKKGFSPLKKATISNVNASSLHLLRRSGSNRDHDDRSPQPLDCGPAVVTKATADKARRLRPFQYCLLRIMRMKDLELNAPAVAVFPPLEIFAHIVIWKSTTINACVLKQLPTIPQVEYHHLS